MSKIRQVSLITLFSVLLTTTLVYQTSNADDTQEQPYYIVKQQDNDNNDELPAEDVQRFVSAFSRIKNYYVKPVTDKQLFDAAIRGMLSSLDPHSAYLNEDEYDNLQTTTSGEFGGLGIELEMMNGYLKVVTPLDDSPASRAGIKTGDMIIAIDSEPVKGLSIEDAVKKMRGPKDSKIMLTVLRGKEEKPLNINLVRDTIKIKSVKGELIDQHYGYVRISQFQSTTADDLKVAVEKLKKDSNNQIYGLVLDLRNNPGGLLETSINVADAFLDTKQKLKYNNLIVYTKGRVEGTELKMAATPGDILNGKPIVVLINGGSASGSEIVAGALQDQKRAILIGQKSFGKGSVQTVLPLDQTHGIKLTTALYYTPSGRSIQATGIIPDIKVDEIQIPEPKGDSLDILDIREAQLRGHLNNGNGKSTETNAAPATTKNSEKPLIYRDFQLSEALNTLKAMHQLNVTYQ